MMKKNIVMVNKFYYPTIGGIESVVRQYADFCKEDYNVTVLCIASKPTKRTSIEYIDDVKVVRCSSLGIFKGLPLSLSFFKEFIRLSAKADIIHGHYPFPLFDVCSIFIKNKNKVVTWHSEIVRQKYLKYLFSFFTKILVNRSFITVTSDSLKRNSKFLMNKNVQEDIFILPLSISNPPYSVCKSRIKDIQGRVLPDKYMLSLGRIANYKGIDILLKAYTISKKNIPLVISGDGPLLNEIISEVMSTPELKDNVYILGRSVSEEEKHQLLSGCDFLLFPSTLPSEAFGIVQLEAMARGKAVINTNLNSGVPWVSTHGDTGLTCLPGNHIELANAIEHISSNDLYLQYGKNARVRYEELFTDDIVKAQYLDMLKKLTN
ncbi:glycosyl hydrolase family 1 [Vibrionales bacterium C3R12]|nr:glycosyl hydrolase family 1 [Vibrionales bacterium C3R12]